MSILIKGMEMPTEGQQKSFLLHFNDDGTANIVALGYPQKPYKVVPVPPHGDLIDRDAYAYPGDLMDEPVIIPAEEGE